MIIYMSRSIIGYINSDKRLIDIYIVRLKYSELGVLIHKHIIVNNISIYCYKHR